MWSFVGNKKRQRWLWYAWEPRLKRIIAHVFGSRSKKTLCKLLKLLSGFSVAFWCTDGYRAYNEKLPKAKHIVGKLYTGVSLDIENYCTVSLFFEQAYL